MLTFMAEMLGKFGSVLKSVLPLSPFISFIDATENLPYLEYLNWFFPVAQCIAILQAWVIAIGLYYLYSIILRWIKAID